MVRNGRWFDRTRRLWAVRREAWQMRRLIFGPSLHLAVASVQSRNADKLTTEMSGWMDDPRRSTAPLANAAERWAIELSALQAGFDGETSWAWDAHGELLQAVIAGTKRVEEAAHRVRLAQVQSEDGVPAAAASAELSVAIERLTPGLQEILSVIRSKLGDRGSRPLDSGDASAPAIEAPGGPAA